MLHEGLPKICLLTSLPFSILTLFALSSFMISSNASFPTFLLAACLSVMGAALILKPSLAVICGSVSASCNSVFPLLMGKSHIVRGSVGINPSMIVGFLFSRSLWCSLAFVFSLIFTGLDRTTESLDSMGFDPLSWVKLLRG